MKHDIHPIYFPHATVHCACGAVFSVGSTKERIEIEICSRCHPLYTGKEKMIDAAGRVEKFRERAKLARPRNVRLQKTTSARPAKKKKK